MPNEGLVVPFLGALQACVSVLLTMCYGFAARRLQLIHETTINDMLGLGVKLLLPALLIVHLGDQLHLGTAMNYIPVIIWSILYTSASIGLAHFLSRLLGLPQWVTPACAFNNTTSLPLPLLHSLESVGSLELILRNDETTSSAIDRAQSYFLVCGVISKTIAYIVGPKMLQDRGDSLDSEERNYTASILAEDEQLSEETSLLPQRAQQARTLAGHLIRRPMHWLGLFFPRRVKQELLAPFESPFADVAILCTILGTVLGLVPSLHRAFFFDEEDGGIFNAWLTSSVNNIGGLFTTLQIFMVGCKLGITFERMVAEGNSARIPVKAITTIFVVRLVAWPALSVSLIYGLAKRTRLLGDDPMLWFSMMLMPAGPPALVISGLAELAQASELEKMVIAKTLTIMYALSPFICFTITGALKASEAVLKDER
ncbi:Auxin efflux carrier [Penicillium concentricum]|uniref:Auxin efflux carrier n=1 Tax=Penicillium concentricum TaxID=293559 RepID=A0A9W9RY04_9EURO|nr:Auxin efflux carrier [Penicillium concentricum]KAJ5365953.1 Auxin efflux carrier [Penicillium concentricum]